MEFDNLMGENGVLEGVNKWFMPTVVDEGPFGIDTFTWYISLSNKESVRAIFVRRANS